MGRAAHGPRGFKASVPTGQSSTYQERLRYQGSADRWAIGIWLASTGQYTEAELPASFGP
jgi:hypothetical protein